jgi:predicted MFS family arabinose efflux permease
VNDARTTSSLRPWLAIAAITASLFAFLTTELMPVGILSPISASLGIPVGVAGLMVTTYGVSAGLGVPFLVATTRRVDRRVLLTALLAVLTLGTFARRSSPTSRWCSSFVWSWASPTASSGPSA